MSLLFSPSVILPASAQKSFLVAQETVESACKRGWNEEVTTMWSTEGYTRGCDRAYFYYTRWLQATGAQPQPGEDLFKTFLEITGQVITAPVTIALETGAQSGQSYTIQQVGNKNGEPLYRYEFQFNENYRYYVVTTIYTQHLIRHSGKIHIHLGPARGRIYEFGIAPNQPATPSRLRQWWDGLSNEQILDYAENALTIGQVLPIGKALGVVQKAATGLGAARLANRFPRVKRFLEDQTGGRPLGTRMTNREARAIAAKLRFTEEKNPPKAVQTALKDVPQGERIVFKGELSTGERVYISPDRTMHGSGESNLWKVFRSDGSRLGTYSQDLGRKIRP